MTLEILLDNIPMCFYLIGKGFAMKMTRNLLSVRFYGKESKNKIEMLRQKALINELNKQEIEIAGIYIEKLRGIIYGLPKLQELINDLRSGEFMFVERIDRLCRQIPAETESMLNYFLEKKITILIPGIINLEDALNLSVAQNKKRQEFLGRIIYQLSKDNDEVHRQAQEKGMSKVKLPGRQADKRMHQEIIRLRAGGKTIEETAKLAGCSTGTVKNVCREERLRKDKDQKSLI